MQSETRKIAPRKKGRKKKATRRRSTMYRSKQLGSISYTEDVIEIRIPKKLKSGNKLKSGIARHGDTQSWEKHLLKALAVYSLESGHVLAPMSEPERMRLEIERYAPRRQFFLDPTNLAIGIKGLEDALVRLGYLYDDAEEWIDGPHGTNKVSDDGTFWTLVKISPAEKH